MAGLGEAIGGISGLAQDPTEKTYTRTEVLTVLKAEMAYQDSCLSASPAVKRLIAIFERME
jgi:hypothetical protein